MPSGGRDASTPLPHPLLPPFRPWPPAPPCGPRSTSLWAATTTTRAWARAPPARTSAPWPPPPRELPGRSAPCVFDHAQPEAPPRGLAWRRGGARVSPPPSRPLQPTSRPPCLLARSLGFISHVGRRRRMPPHWGVLPAAPWPLYLLERFPSVKYTRSLRQWRGKHSLGVSARGCMRLRPRPSCIGLDTKSTRHYSRGRVGSARNQGSWDVRWAGNRRAFRRRDACARLGAACAGSVGNACEAVYVCMHVHGVEGAVMWGA